MLFRRRGEELRAVEDVDEAQKLIAEIREQASRLRTTPGLIDGTVEDLVGSIERLLREYSRMSRRRLSPFSRDAEEIAERATELQDAGRLSPRHAKLIARALQHARRIHFWNARKVLEKLASSLAPAREWQRSLDEYRAFHRKAVQRVRDAERAIERLQSVPRPEAGADEVARARTVVEACNRAADEAWARQTHRPIVEALQDLVSHPDIEGLGLLSTLEFACLRGLSDLLEERPTVQEVFGSRPLMELVGASQYSVGKWDRVYPEATRERKKLQDLFHQLRPVVTGRYGSSFDILASVDVLERRVGAWRTFPDVPASAPWEDLEALAHSGRVPAIQQSARAYERYGDLAERAWNGSLGDEVQEQEEELTAAREALEGLPAPDDLVQ